MTSIGGPLCDEWGVADRGEFVGVADKVDGCDDAVLRRHRHHLCYCVTSRENGTGGAADDGRLGGQVAAVAAGHGYEEAGHPAGADDRAASGPAFGTTVGEAYDLRRQADDDLVHVAGSQRTEQAVDITAAHRTASDRVQTARAERRSLLLRLAAATTDAEVTSLKARLRDAGRRIAADLRALHAVDRQAAYADIAVTLQASAAGGAAGGRGDHRFTPGAAARDALRVLEVAAGVLLIVLAAALPLALLVAAAVAAQRLRARRGRARVLDAV